VPLVARVGRRHKRTFKCICVELSYITTQLREGPPKVKQGADGVNEGVLLYRHEFAQEFRPKSLDWNGRVDVRRLFGAGSLCSLHISARHPYHRLGCCVQDQAGKHGCDVLRSVYLCVVTDWLVYVAAEMVTP
jgi:hypothetical protein